MDWCILRTSGRATLRLAESLKADGFDVWTPARDYRIRKPRWNVARSVRLPLMPSFVFARARHLAALLELEDRPDARRLGFSVFRYFDKIPLVADHDLDPLRAEETAAPRAGDFHGSFRPGEKVLVTGGVFGGMGGIVERNDGTYTLVRFGTRMRVKISTFILQPNCVTSRSQPAARAA